MQIELKVGDPSVILAALQAVTKLSFNAQRDEIIVSSDTSEIDALRAKMEREREPLLNAYERDAVLHTFQREEHRLGAWHYQLSSNLYGWCVGESLRSNMGGGRWAQTPRGYTLAQALEWGCQQAASKNVRFSFAVKHLPEDLKAEVMTLVAR